MNAVNEPFKPVEVKSVISALRRDTKEKLGPWQTNVQANLNNQK